MLFDTGYFGTVRLGGRGSPSPFKNFPGGVCSKILSALLRQMFLIFQKSPLTLEKTKVPFETLSPFKEDSKNIIFQEGPKFGGGKAGKFKENGQ